MDEQILDVAIIGAGFSGIAMAQALNAAGRRHFLVLEKAAAVGGTWRENRYPGAACDVPSHLYSLGFAPNAQWTRMFPEQPEIERYLQTIAAQAIAPEQLVLGWCLQRAQWDEARARWILTATDGRAVQARVLVAAMGGLHVPATPSIPGIESFSGACFHTARWPEGLDLTQRRAAIIGTGASAVQVVPKIAPALEQLYVIQRTPAWVLPRPDSAMAPSVRTAFAKVPGLRKAFRGAIWLSLELLSSGLLHPRSAFWARAWARAHLRRQIADPALRAKLTPNYAIGCKRVLLSSDYYPALARSNVELVNTAVSAVEPAGVRLSDGRLLQIDTLILATGFQPMAILNNTEILGRDGHVLSQDWSQRPRSWHGVSVHGYPNLFFLLGPNSALGHNSVLLMIEAQVQHVLSALEQLDHARTLEVTAAAQERFIAEIDQRLTGTAWVGGCHSWYLNPRGENIALWVGSTSRYRRAVQGIPAGVYVLA